MDGWMGGHFFQHYFSPLGLPLGCSDLPPLALILSRQLWGLPQDWAGVALSCLPLRLDKQKSLFSLPCLVPLQPRAGSCWQVSWQVSCCNLILRLNLSSWALGLSGSTVELGMMGGVVGPLWPRHRDDSYLGKPQSLLERLRFWRWWVAII